MAYRGTYYVQADFSGGYYGAIPATDLSLNQATDLDNVVIGIGGKSFRSTWPTIRFNATEFGSANSFPVIGVGMQFPTSAGVGQPVVVRNGKAYSLSSGDVGFRDSCSASDITGSVTISTALTAIGETLENRWHFCCFNNVLIAFGGGQVNTPDAPWKWTGSGNIAALGGSPPSARFCFTANNRVFAGSTDSYPGKLFWSILGNGEDWTGAGSGSAEIGSLGDGDKLMAAAVMPNNTALLFKANNTYIMPLDAAPFGHYMHFPGVGANNADAVVVVDGICYFVNGQGHMYVTDGTTLTKAPNQPIDLLADVYLEPGLGYPAVFGYRKKTDEYDWVVWSWLKKDLDGTRLAIIWDINNKCWLKSTTGFNFTSGAQNSQGEFLAGGYSDGRVYSTDVAGYGTNDTDGTTTITSFWRTPWIASKTLENITSIRRVGLDMNTVASGTSSSLSNDWTVSYGFDFIPDTKSTTISAAADSTEIETFRYANIFGRGGNVVQFKFSWLGNGQSNMGARINNILYAGKSSGERRISSP